LYCPCACVAALTDSAASIAKALKYEREVRACIDAFPARIQSSERYHGAREMAGQLIELNCAAAQQTIG
jgi:hypothetical protein